MLKPIVASFAVSGLMIGGSTWFKASDVDIVAHAKESSVIIETVTAKVNSEGEHEHHLGSGFFINDHGNILTASHVIQGGKVTVKTSDGKERAAKVVIDDPADDFAVLKIDGVSGHAFMRLGDSNKLREGQPITEIGNAWGLGEMVTKGIVSNRDIELGGQRLFVYDAATNHGNSGGVLFTEDGDAVGIADAIYSEVDQNSGTSFAVPTAVIMARMDQYNVFAPSKPEPVKSCPRRGSCGLT